MNDIDIGPSGQARPDAPTISDIAHLGGRGTLYLLALLQAQQLRKRVAPTEDATAALLAFLDALGVVRAENKSSHASSITLVEKLPWTYTWSQVPLGEVEDRLYDHLTNASRSSFFASAWLRVWQELIPAEVIAYLQHQLRLHQFSDDFLEELMPSLVPNESRYSLGHWRYACWVAVRRMASVSLQHPGNIELLKVTLRNELPRRLQIALETPGGKFCFSPSYSIPDSALSVVFSSVATGLGENYWKCPPRLELVIPRQGI